MTPKAEQEPFSDYLQNKAVNFSRLKRMDWSPAHYACEAPQSDTAALSIGRLIHLAILEPSLFEASIAQWKGGMTKGKNPRPTFNKNSDAFKQFKAECDAMGKVIVDEGELWLCQSIAAAVKKHEAAAEKLSWPGQSEVSIYWEHPIGIQCKSRIDWLGDHAIIDLKSTADLRQEEFGKSAYRYRYHAQAAMYQDAIKALTGEVRPYFIVAVEKTAPFDVVCYEVPEVALEAGRRVYQDWMLAVQKCRSTGAWPGVCATSTTLELPNWAYAEMDDGKLVIDGMEVSV